MLSAGTNGSSTWEVIEHTARAREIGYKKVVLATPYYTRPSDDELLAHYQSVMDAVDVELVLYSYPAKDGIEVSFSVMDALADHPRVIGIKDSSGVLQRAVEIYSRYRGRIELFSGSDNIALDFMFWGADIWICGPANCMAAACVDLDRSYRAGNLEAARDRMTTLYRAMNSLESGKVVQKIKYGCELMGTPVGHCRQPLLPLTDQENADFRTAMESVINRSG
jgi:4-hydroxy-tetrahydrodipicolinate synthase